MPWIRHKLRDSEVWARVDDSGALVPDGAGRVEVLYKAVPGAKVYRASARNLVPVGGDPVEIEAGPAAEPPAPRATAAAGGSRGAPMATPAPANAIHVWTDGACTGNPGPAALGVVVIDGKDRKELSEYLGEGTNNIAELAAIERGLATVAERDRPVYVYSDSSYAIGLLSKNWKAKANVELVDRIRSLTKQFPKLTFVKVAGHAGIAENERCDYLARDAITRRR
jgi:ribonuclease HI